MKAFQEPDRELAERILAEVGFHDRLVGYRMRRRMGPVAVSLYSLEEVIGFLSEEMPQLDVDGLHAWVRGTMKDTDLARAIQDINSEEGSDREKLLQIRNLMAARLIQCKRMA